MVVARTDDDLIAAVAAADAAGEPVLLVGGGSNLVVADEGFDGVMIQVATRGVISDVSDCAGAVVTVAAGEPWDGVVDHAVQQGWIGLEALSGIPGLTGATPIQNVGAYGADVSQTISQVRTWDRCERTFRTFPAVDCAFSYRSSRFKAEPDRYLVVSVSYQLRLGDLSAPVRYADLAVRRSKGMVLDDADHDTWSAGSFFTNPVLESSAADRLPADAPRHLQPDGTVKTSAAWLIEHAGYGRGYHLAGAGEPRAALSTKHTLAVTNRGSARTRDVLDLARTVRDGVDAAYGVVLEPEPVLVGCRL
jgi:UDP-N-acetylmuramate dehydrogenase